MFAIATSSLCLLAPFRLFAMVFPWLKPTSVAGKHVLLTGASEGIGKCIALLAAKNGAHVTIISRSQKKLEIAIEEIRKESSSQQITDAISADVSSWDSISKALEKAIGNHQGRLRDFVFSCAGMTQPGNFVDTPLETHRMTYGVNFFGSLHVAKALLRCISRKAPVPQFTSCS
eukprot:EC124886.1.p1 GENE.EC124886.1~~EC124886.1.p1  ORF type:complete len:174 (+),score=24.74 EC124886.1:185-706(+)